MTHAAQEHKTPPKYAAFRKTQLKPQIVISDRVMFQSADFEALPSMSGKDMEFAWMKTILVNA